MMQKDNTIRKIKIQRRDTIEDTRQKETSNEKATFFNALFIPTKRKGHG